MTKTIQIPDFLHDYLVRKTRRKESFGETLSRLLRVKPSNRVEPPKPEEKSG